MQGKLTKILATLGPKTGSKEMIKKLIESGINGVRLNFSHGDFQEHLERIENAHNAMKETGKYIAILIDTQGPEIRTGKIKNGKIEISKGDSLILNCGEKEFVGDKEKIWINYQKLNEDVKKGDTILINDGMIKLEVQKIEGKNIHCQVIKGGEITNKRGVNVPGIKLQLPDLTEYDQEVLKRMCDKNVDYVALSFVRNAETIKQARKILNQNGGEHIKIIAKIENQEGIDNFEEILKQSDGIMVARGDMGTEIPYNQVPLMQKKMIKLTNDYGKIAITATEMLQSMISNPRPTRAEVSDVANAIFDGTDVVMLSGETASPSAKYPIQAVESMSEICKTIDKEIDGTQFDIKTPKLNNKIDTTLAIAKGAVETAKFTSSKIIVAISETGNTVSKIRKYYPTQPIIVISPNEHVARQVSLIRGAIGFYIPEINKEKNIFEFIKNFLTDKKLINKGDFITCTCSSKIQGHGNTDMLKIFKF